MNIELLQAARQSIIDDPDFDMSSWDHCIAGHILKMAGIPVRLAFGPYPYSSPHYAAIVSDDKGHMEARSVAKTAEEAVGDRGVSRLFSYHFVTHRTNKDLAIAKLDRYIEEQQADERQAEAILAEAQAMMAALVPARVQAREEVYEEVSELALYLERERVGELERERVGEPELVGV